jgi:class 3 adenylate cyclase
MSGRDVRKIVTVVFCDLVGFTGASEGRDPEVVRREQQRYFDGARAALERHGGTVEKFIGDAVMAVFGVPRAHEDDAVRALRAAIDLRDEIRALGLTARIGVDSGEVVAAAGPRDALVTGDAVNMASRFEHAATADQIWLGEATLTLAHGLAVTESVGPLAVKGRSEPVPTYRLLDVGAAGTARRATRPMVGRDDELAALEDLLEAVRRDRRCRLATIVGGPGIGKSRLASALGASAARHAHVWVGTCRSYGEGLTYGPLREIYARAGDPAGLDRALALGSRDETARAVRLDLERRARDHPVVLLIEDVHWAEPTLLELVEHVAELSSDAPILIVCLARPELLEARPAWGARVADAVMVRLDALSDDACEHLLADRGLVADPAAGRRLIETAGGNPLFLEELAAVAGQPGPTVMLPPTIQAVLTSRLEALPDEERLVAEVASVEGTAFHRAAVAALAGLTGDAVDRHLHALAIKEFVLPLDTTAPRVDEDTSFRHQLIRDAAYARLSKADRSAWHEGIAGWLDDQGSTRRPVNDEIVGYHLERACRLTRELDPDDPTATELARAAASRLADAGARAFARSDMPAAANLLGRSVDLLEPCDPLRLRSMPDLGNALASIGRMREADETLAAATDEARVTGERAVELRAEVERGLLHLMIDTSLGGAGARREGQRLLADLEGSGDDRAIARAWHLVGFAELYAGRMGEMETAMRRSVDHAARAGDAQQRSVAIGWLAGAIARGPTPTSVGIAELERLRSMVAPGSVADAGVLVNLGLLYGVAGRIGDGRTAIARGREMLGALGQRFMQEVYAMELCDAERFAGDASPAVPDLRHAAAALETMGERDYRSTVCAYLARALAERGAADEAERWAEESAATAAEDDTPSQITIRLARATVATGRDDRTEAARLAREAVALAEGGDDPVGIGDATLALAEILRGTPGGEAEASALAERALALFDAKGAVRLADRARTLLADGWSGPGRSRGPSGVQRGHVAGDP